MSPWSNRKPALGPPKLRCYLALTEFLKNLFTREWNPSSKKKTSYVRHTSSRAFNGTRDTWRCQVEFNQIHQAKTLMYLECKDCVKYLGVLIVYKLSGKNHVDSIALKISKTIGLLSKLRPFFPHHTLVNIYNSLITQLFAFRFNCVGPSQQNTFK